MCGKQEDSWMFIWICWFLQHHQCTTSTLIMRTRCRVAGGNICHSLMKLWPSCSTPLSSALKVGSLKHVQKIPQVSWLVWLFDNSIYKIVIKIYNIDIYIYITYIYISMFINVYISLEWNPLRCHHLKIGTPGRSDAVTQQKKMVRVIWMTTIWTQSFHRICMELPSCNMKLVV